MSAERIDRLDQLVAAAIDDGALPPDAQPPAAERRPWPVVVMIGLGAWLATIPLMLAVGMLFGKFIEREAGALAVGALLLAVAVVLFRAKDVPIFVEQLALPALLVGGAVLGYALSKFMPHPLTAAAMGVIAVVIAMFVRATWVRNLLGVIAAVLITLACVDDRALNFHRDTIPQFWIAWHLTFALWLVAQWIQEELAVRGNGSAFAAAIESFGAGWLLASLVGFAWYSGMTFLVGGVFERNIAGEIAREISGRARAGMGPASVQAAISVALAGTAAWCGARAWPSLRRPWLAVVAAMLLVLSWFMTVLGAVLLALVVCAIAHRWVLAGTAAVALAWIVGAFYYQLDTPLTQKALILFAVGAVLAATAWFAVAADREPAADAGEDGSARAAAALTLGPLGQAGIAASVVLTLVAVNFAIWDKENVIAHGKPVYVELAPMDPRSLMQGDYMAINFRVPFDRDGELDRLLTTDRPHAVARLDQRGVATLVRLDRPGVPLAPGEFRIELTPKNGRWILVTDAWFFREGDAGRWSKAKFGEFRVTDSGKALLVGMTDADLKPIR